MLSVVTGALPKKSSDVLTSLVRNLQAEFTAKDLAHFAACESGMG
jgi:hypothetical protein